MPHCLNVTQLLKTGGTRARNTLWGETEGFRLTQLNMTMNKPGFILSVRITNESTVNFLTPTLEAEDAESLTDNSNRVDKSS